MHETTTTTLPPPRRASRWMRRIGPIVVLAAAVGAGIALIKTPPRAISQPSVQPATLVEVMPVEFQTQPVKIDAMGTVRPAQQIELLPRVGGEVQWVSEDFVPGGIFEKGGKLLEIDPLDYELAKRAADKTVAEARMALRVEQGAQAVAREDFELLGEIVGESDRDLVLRKPQLDMAQATLEAAEAGLERSQIDLERTSVRTPFNAIVQGAPVNVGARVTPSNPLATLIGTDSYWIEATAPVGLLKWITIPAANSEAGSTVRIFDDAAWGAGQSRTGVVRRLAASLEEQGRMARLIIEVEDPLSLRDPSKPRLLIGSFVRVEFEGQKIPDAVRLSQSLVHEGDQVWLLSQNGTLDIREVAVAIRGRDSVVITGGLHPGEQIITTNLSAPVQGMALRTGDEKAASAEPLEAP